MNKAAAQEDGIVAARRLTCRIEAVLVADGESFVTRPVDEVAVDLDGLVVAQERHRGATRPADVRVPFYPRGTPIKNARQLSLVSVEDLAGVADDLAIPAVRPEWLGANLVISGLPRFSFLPRGTRLLFPDTAALAIEDQNAPCRGPGRVVQAAHPERPGLDLDFVKVAARRRGLVAWVERAGLIRAGDTVQVRVP